MKNEKKDKLLTLHEKMEHLSEMLDSLDPEQTEVADIDRIIHQLDELEKQCQDYRRKYE